ncbi:beta-propeller domain-containing protein [Patescibacteria group bacterium]
MNEGQDFSKNNSSEEIMNEDIDVNIEAPKKQNHFSVLFVFLLFLFVGSFALWYKNQPDTPTVFPKKSGSDEKVEQLIPFKSSEDFLSYISEGENLDLGFFGGFATSSFSRSTPMMTEVMDEAVSLPLAGGGAEKSAQRVSETNVQVSGIDEPDIVKTDGKHIFTSLLGPSYRLMVEEDVLPMTGTIESSSEMIFPPRKRLEPTTKIVSAFPPADLEKISDIDMTGDLLLSDDLLMVFGNDLIQAYDVSNPSSPKDEWDIEIDSNSSIMTSRLKGDELYVVTRTGFEYDQPCPISPLSPVGGLIIPCERIFHPNRSMQADVTYSALKIDLDDGSVTHSISFVGTYNSSVIYMSENSLYVTYTTFGDFSEFIFGFFTSLGSDLVSSEVVSKLKKLSTYDISSAAKMTEIQTIMEEYYRGLSKDERRRIENEVSDRMEEYATENMREMEKTGIVKVELDDMKILSTGSIPGHPLNQFSLDEYKENLRIAVTVGGRSLRGSESANDVYVLDKNLETLGQVKDLGLDEKIYSARFLGEMGYLVTFRETDPFYVLDLSDAKNPTMKGELKIPGFSSYLHPLEENLILGVGRDEGRVKLSLFDVSVPTDPKEVDVYLLDAYWSDVSNTHHAFLQDEKHSAFFIPAGNDGFIFSYSKEGVSLKKVVSDIQAKRALFLDDYLYVVGTEKIVVLNESDWERVNSLNL